ncbi:unnamed protein product, partial [Brachionus calyciflorus]
MKLPGLLKIPIVSGFIMFDRNI